MLIHLSLVHLLQWIGRSITSEVTYGLVTVDHLNNFTCIKFVSKEMIDSNFKSFYASPAQSNEPGPPRNGSLIKTNPKFDFRDVYLHRRNDTLQGQGESKLRSFHKEDLKSPNLIVPNSNDRNISRKMVIDGRIAQGHDVKPGEVPYYVALVQHDGLIYCGGTLITPNWFQSAKKCFAKKILFWEIWNKIQPMIVAGAIHRDFNLDVDPGLQTNWIKLIYWHENADIALVKLETPMNTINYVKPIGYYTSSNSSYVSYQIAHLHSVEVSGFGIGETGDVPDILQSASLKLLNDQWECLVSAEFNGQTIIDTHAFICTSYGEFTFSPCQGDEGGPLILTDKLVGVVTSVNQPCGYPGEGVYMRVDYFYPWIQKVMKSAEDGSDDPSPNIVLGVNVPQSRIDVIVACLVMVLRNTLYSGVV